MHWRNALSYISQVIVLGLAMAFIDVFLAGGRPARSPDR